jgi:hypothetical protein
MQIQFSPEMMIEESEYRSFKMQTSYGNRSVSLDSNKRREFFSSNPSTWSLVKMVILCPWILTASVSFQDVKASEHVGIYHRRDSNSARETRI